jgi:hypothetical protein
MAGCLPVRLAVSPVTTSATSLITRARLSLPQRAHFLALQCGGLQRAPYRERIRENSDRMFHPCNLTGVAQRFQADLVYWVTKETGDEAALALCIKRERNCASGHRRVT